MTFECYVQCFNTGSRSLQTVLSTYHLPCHALLRLCRVDEHYCKTFNVCVPFISWISQAKQNRKIKGREYRYCTNSKRHYSFVELCGLNSPT